MAQCIFTPLRNCSFLAIFVWAFSCSQPEEPGFNSPDGRVSIQFVLNENGAPNYSVLFDDTVVIETSPLGLVTNEADFSTQMKLTGESEITKVSDTYTLFTGKQTHYNYSAHAQTYYLENTNGKKLNITFQLSDNGVAFRYEFPKEDSTVYAITEEKTGFQFPSEAKAWLQHLAEVNTGWSETNPSYEEHYKQNVSVGTECPTKAGWAFPALFKSGNTWLLISETGVDKTHHGTRLAPNAEGGLYKIDQPMAEEVITGESLLSTSALPWKLPWRIIALGNNLGNIVESTLGTDLAHANALADTSWIKPGIASWSWALLKDNSIRYNVQKRFIDYAAEMNWQYCLVDVNWDRNEGMGYEKTEELAQYALAKNVGLILWYNSSGDWNSTEYTPKSKLLTHEQRMAEFARLEKMGVKGIKVDFFAGDGQSVMKYYQDILEDAAQFHLLVNFHGATIPRGWQRTYPNLMTMESIKGFEFITFGQPDADLQPTHCAMMPFTRNVYDPMDFTPMCFTEIPNIKRVTTNGFELALPFLFTSGIQHMAETAEGIKTIPNYIYDILQSIPTRWDDTKFIDGYPGKLAVIARKSGDTWYVAGINGENVEKDLSLDLSELGDQLNGLLIEDGETNRDFKQSAFFHQTRKKLDIRLKGNGGFLLKVK